MKVTDFTDFGLIPPDAGQQTQIEEPDSGSAHNQ